MKRGLRVGLIALAVLAGLVAAAPFVLRPPKVSPEAIRTSVTRTPALLERAWALPVAAAFQKKLVSQSNGSFCGPSSLANVFRSLGEGATREDRVLAGTGKCWSGMCFMGLTLDELGDVAREHTQRSVKVIRDLTPEAFEQHLRKSNDPKRRYVANFTRKAIFGAGGGHHSPIGGYLEPEDLVFVLDVNSDYGPWLIERSRLFAAIDTLDGEHKRGLLQIE